MFQSIFRSISKSPFEVLGISPNSTKPEIKAKYYELAKKLHPDLHGGNATKFQELNIAYQKIMSGEVKKPLSQQDREKRAEEFYKSMKKKERSSQRKASEEQHEKKVFYRLYASLFLTFFILYPIALYTQPKNQFNRPILVTPEEFERIMREEEEEDYF